MNISEEWRAALAAWDEVEIERLGRLLVFLELEEILTNEEIWSIREGLGQCEIEDRMTNLTWSSRLTPKQRQPLGGGHR